MRANGFFFGILFQSCSKDREKEGKNKKRQEEDRVSVLRTDTEKKQMFSPEHQDVEQLSPETKKLRWGPNSMSPTLKALECNVH